MAYDSETSPSWWRRHGWTVVSLVFIMALAGFFRIGFNYGPAINEGDYRFAGNDDYYHLRVVQHVQTEGRHLLHDDLLNYPVTALNPRPPVYDWHVAMAGQGIHWFTGWTPEKGGAYALEYGSAVWGILICIPIWLIGRALYSNRAGLWAAFLVAASPAHIQRAGFGLGDHDAFILFFLTLGFYFLLRALQLTRDDVRVERWSSLESVGRGFGEYVDAHLEGLAYALLAGVSFATIALMWEGFPYVPAIFMLYYGIQILTNHLRRRDSTGDVLIATVIMSTLLVASLPYYWTAGHIGATLTSTMYLVAIMAVGTLVLVPTRDIPSLLVLPATFVAGLVGYAAVKFVWPDIGRALFSANGYFVQSKLYSTIAEAQRTELSVFVFSIGFMTFFLALVGFGFAVGRFFRKQERDQAFMVVWGLFSIYMAFAAARFVFNAAPAFAILAGWMVDRILRWMNLRERLREFQSQRHQSMFKGVRALMGAKQVAGSLFIGLTLVVPSVWFSFDAGFPSEVRANYRNQHGANDFVNNRTGAFGQGFLAEDWIDIYGWYQEQDLVGPNGQPLSCSQRPAHIAWWDYGFWEVALGCHPTVADNFQNGHQLAGRFLVAESEEEAIEWLILRLLEGDWARNHGTKTHDLLEQLRPGLADELNPLLKTRGYDRARALLHAELPTLEDDADFYEQVKAATGWDIGYFLADLRMLPLDFPETFRIDQGSIFYAPAFLANKNPDDFVKTVYVDSRGSEYTVKAYYVDESNVSRQLPQPRIEDSAGRVFFVSGGGLYRATDDGKRIDYGFNGGQPLQVQSVRLKFEEAFYRTMFYRAYIGGGKPTGGDYPQEFLQYIPNSGQDLKHFRLVRGGPERPGDRGDIESIRLLKYYRGALATGTVTFAATGPLNGLTVEALDDFGIRHDAAITDGNGTYRLLVPFSRSDPNGTLLPIKLRVSNGGFEIANATFTVTEAQAQRRVDFIVTQDLLVSPGTVQGLTYLDKDRDGAYNESKDQLASGVTITADGKSATSGADGRFVLAGLIPGAKNLQLNFTHYRQTSGQVTVQGGGVHDVVLPLVANVVPVNGTLHNATGGALGSVPVDFVALDPDREYTQNQTATTDGTGAFETSLVPGGGYEARVDAEVTEDGKQVRYAGAYQFDVAVGSAPVTIRSDQLVLTRTEVAST